MPIGVFDSGLGGLTVLSRLRATFPNQSFVYFGDNRNAPIGPRAPGEIFDITVAACEMLFARRCNLVILACNTASAVALRMMHEVWLPADRRVLGVMVPMIEALVGQPWASGVRADLALNVTLFATPATVASGAFSRETALRATGVEIVEIACPGLVDALETGASERAADLVARFVEEARTRMPEPDVAVLGCTHYPLAEAQFQAGLPGVRLLNQPRIVADSLGHYLSRHPRFTEVGETVYLTSGDAGEVAAAARRFLGQDLPFTRV